MSKTGYYPGCSLKQSAHEYDLSSRLVCRRLGIELEELTDWSCCGAHAAHHTNHMLAVALSARNLSIATTRGLNNVVAPCPACYSNLKSTQVQLANDSKLREEFKAELDLDCNPKAEVFSLLELLAKMDPEQFQSKVTVELKELKLVAYYGCLLVRPPMLTRFDDPENPCSMDNLLASVGVKTLPWDYKVQCCGATLGIGCPEIQLKLSGDVLEMAQLAGSEAVVVACPLCHANLDLRQKQIDQHRGTEFNLPIFYFTQVLGLAFGLSPKELGIDKHMIDARPLMAKIGIK
jgi:heterodisulfide reductase subunit B